MGAAFTATAQDNQPPQVLTSDLASRHVADRDNITVNFVIVDTDNVTKVTINGEPQKFEAGDTVLLTKEFTFPRGLTTVKIVAEDEKGNVRERSFLVARGVPLPPIEKKKKEEPKLSVAYVVEVGYEVDDNPTQDLSLPISVSQIGDIQGVVDDSQQADTRITLKGVISVSKGAWSGFGGVSKTDYSDAANEGLSSQVIFVGGNWNPSMGDGFRLGANLSMVELGGNAYANLLTISPATQSSSKDSKGTSRSLWGVDVTSKSFEDSSRDSATVLTVKWVGDSLDKEKLDSSHKVFSFGTASEGTANTEFNFIGWDADWKNRWDSGFRWDIGWGYQARNYPNDEDIITDKLFGATRVDNLLRFSTGIGWEFTPRVSALLNYRYLTDLSNDSPYVRQIYGVRVKGVF